MKSRRRAHVIAAVGGVAFVALAFNLSRWLDGVVYWVVAAIIGVAYCVLARRWLVAFSVLSQEGKSGNG